MKITNTALENLLVSPEDADLNLYRWCWSAGGYAVSAFYLRGDRVSIRIHRAVLCRKLGRELGAGELADHINGNRLDNRRENLRAVTLQQNAWNKTSQKGSRSQYIGVGFSNRSKRWLASVKRDDLRFHIGYFDTAEEAAWMRDQWALEIQDGYARLNFEYVPVVNNQPEDDFRRVLNVSTKILDAGYEPQGDDES